MYGPPEPEDDYQTVNVHAPRSIFTDMRAVSLLDEQTLLEYVLGKMVGEGTVTITSIACPSEENGYCRRSMQIDLQNLQTLADMVLSDI